MSGVLGAFLWNKTITITNAQIKALPTAAAPVEIIPAPGAGRMAQLVYALIQSNIVAPYTNIDPAAWGVLEYTNESIESSVYFNNDAAENLAAVTALLTETRILQLCPSTKTTTTDFAGFTIAAAGVFNVIQKGPALVSSLANQSISLFLSNQASGDFTGGSPANTLTVTTFYAVVEL